MNNPDELSYLVQAGYISTKHRKPEQIVRSAISAAKSRAKLNNGEFELDFEWALTRFNAGCEISGLAFDTRAGVNGFRNPRAFSIDRINNSDRSYSLENSRAITLALNTAFSNWGEAELYLQVARASTTNRRIIMKRYKDYNVEPINPGQLHYLHQKGYITQKAYEELFDQHQMDSKIDTAVITHQDWHYHPDYGKE